MFRMSEMFLSHIERHREYISHGELQMGVGTGEIVDGVLQAAPSPDAEKMWLKYISGHIEGEDWAVVNVAETVPEEAGEDGCGTVIGFSVADIEEDGGQPFGMVCDVLVREDCRGTGAGTALLNASIDWLRSKGIRDIYLESGRNNHAAHEYFGRHGFHKISEIFKLA